MKFKLTKNKMDLNIRKMTNHPPSPEQNNKVNNNNNKIIINKMKHSNNTVLFKICKLKKIQYQQ